MSSNHDLEERYREFILQLANEITDDNFDDLKYLLRNFIGAGKIENLRRPLHLFMELEKRGCIRPQNLDELRRCLTVMKQQRLVSMVENFERSCGLSSSKIIAKPENENYLAMGGYSLRIKGGQHFDTERGETVELLSGERYALVIRNKNWHRCSCEIKIDGQVVFSKLILHPQQSTTLERPSQNNGNYKFFAFVHAPSGSGISAWRGELNGRVDVTFTPERADMKISCYVNSRGRFYLTCSCETTAAGFHKMILSVFQAFLSVTEATELPPMSVYFATKLIGPRTDVKLTQYGICHGSCVHINFGMAGGGIFTAPTAPYCENREPLSIPREWLAGATTLVGESKQNFETSFDFIPWDTVNSTTLHLRLVAQKGKFLQPQPWEVYTPLIKETLIPPPVKNW